MKPSLIVFLLVILSLALSACASSSIDDVDPFINPSTVTPKYGEGGYKLEILPISFEEIPYDLSDSYVAYYAMYEINPTEQMTFTRIFVGSNFEGKPNVHYFKVIPVQVETGPVTAFDENAREAMLELCLAISK